MNRKIIVLVVLVLIFITGFFLSRSLWMKSDFSYAGTLEATRIDLPARVPTVVDTIDVEEGQKIKKGQQLATLGCEDLKIGSALVNKNYDRALTLWKSGAYTKETYDQFRNRKEDSDTRLSWCNIVSPVNGTVLTKYLEAKEWVNPGSKILSVADLSDIWAYIYVPQKIMSRLKVGAEVKGVIPELDKKEFAGVIQKINDEAEFTPKNVQTRAERTRLVFGVKIAFKNLENEIKPGMTIEINLPE